MPQNINDRQIEILYELLNIENNNKYITNNQLSEKIGVSKRTIRRELKILEEYFKNRDEIRLIKKRGKGNRLITNQKQRLKLINLYQKHQQNSTYLEPEKRKIEIIYFLLKNDGVNNINILEKKLNISSSTLNRDLKGTEKFLKKFDLKLITSDKNTKKIIGNEFKLRMLTVKIILEIISEKKQYLLLEKLKQNNVLKKEDFKVLNVFNLLINIKNVYIQLINLQKKYELNFIRKSFLFILIYLSCSIERSSRNLKINNIDNLSIFKNEFNFSKDAAPLISELTICFPQKNKKEKAAIFILLLALTNFKKDLQINSYFNNNLNNTIKNTSEQIINIYQGKLSDKIKLDNSSAQMDLNNFLINIILNHSFSLNIDYYSIQKHELKKIMENNPYTFYIADSFKDIIENNLNLKIKARELNYLGIIFLKFMESKPQSMKALIINDNNFALNDLIKTRLENSFANIIFTSKNYFSVLESELKNYDLIISSKYFAELKSTIVISPIVNTTDRKKIEEKIKVINDLKRFIT
ncbi:MAG: BglG family transcription antiterminator [Halanaerobium sp.]